MGIKKEKPTAGDDKKGKPTAGDKKGKPTAGDKKVKPTGDDKKGKPTGDDKKVEPTAGDRKPPSAEEIAGYIMKHFDQNGNGKISKKECKRAMKMFNDADVDNNDAVDME